MAWIETIPYERAAGRLRKLYDRIKGPDGQVDNILQAHGLRPASLQGHMTLYKNVLHHLDNALPKWQREAIGTYVSILNGCDYCAIHHYEGMKRLLGDDVRSEAIGESLKADQVRRVFEEREAILFDYARKLTLAPAELSEADLEPMRRYGYEDAVILEVNQIVAYFAYANRTVLGLGVNTEGDVLGLSPSDGDNSDSWNHV